ncbi:MAG TPA: HK97 gp10 family phage protein [Anaeromyxobacter sp.]|nr:HK97 gp10 family phage protein [Anaeromyxobacter sp.]
MAELEAKLENLLAVGGRPNRALNEAGRVAWRSALDDARRRVPTDTGALKASLGIASRAPKAGERSTVSTVHVSGLRIGKVPKPGTRRRERYVKKFGTRRLASGKVVPVNPRRYWHLVEFGVGAHGIPARSYLRSTMDANATDIAARFRDALAPAVQKALDATSKVDPG